MVDDPPVRSHRTCRHEGGDLPQKRFSPNLRLCHSGLGVALSTPILVYQWLPKVRAGGREQRDQEGRRKAPRPSRTWAARPPLCSPHGTSSGAKALRKNSLRPVLRVLARPSPKCSSNAGPAMRVATSSGMGTPRTSLSPIRERALFRPPLVGSSTEDPGL